MTSEPMYRQIYNELLRGIKDGTYPSGSRLPSEKELSEKYSVSRITSKKSLEMLADRGLIMRKPGKGSYVLQQSEQDIQEKDMLQNDLWSDSSEDIEETISEMKTERPLIGVIMDTVSCAFGCDLIKGLESESTRRGVDMLIRFSNGSMEMEKNAIADLRRRGAQGIILMSVMEQTYNEDILKMCVEKFPLVLVDRKLEGLPLPMVVTDNYKASCDLTEKLIREGHKNIAFISHSFFQISSVNDRFYGYRNTMLAHGLVVDKSMCVLDVDYLFLRADDGDPLEEQETVKRLGEYVQQHPEITAYYTVSFRFALLMREVLKIQGIENKKIVCFDGMDDETGVAPLFTHISQGQFEMGVTSVRMLLQRIRGEDAVGIHYVPYTIVEV